MPQSHESSRLLWPNLSRRDLLRAPALATLPLLTLSSQATAQGTDTPTTVEPIFGLGETLSAQDAKRIYSPDIRAQGAAPRQHMLFFHDEASKTLINPLNVEPDPTFKSGVARSFEAGIRAFHASTESETSLWRSVQNDLQVQLGASVPAEDGDLTWILLSGIRVFLSGKADDTDQRLATFQKELSPTAELRPNVKVEIPDGRLSLQLQLFGQKKRSVWAQLLKIAGAAANSFAFGTLAIPKLVAQGVQFTTTVLDHLHAQSRVVPVLTSGNLDCRISGDVRNVDFTLRPGYWVAVDRAYAMSRLDRDFNLRGHRLNVGSQFFDVVDSGSRPLDTDYVVLRFDFPALKK